MLFEKKKEWMLTIGMFSLIFALILDIFAGNGTLVDFFSGLFTGLSLTTNVAYLIKFRQESNLEITQT